MTPKNFLLAVLVFAISGISQAAISQVIFTNDFEDDPLGTYTRSNLNADWNTPPFNNGVDEGRVTIVNDGSGKALRVLYPSGLYGSGDDETGAQWKLEFGQGYEAVELAYRIKFEDGFDFVRGGKLPGLIGGEGNVGGDVPDGTDGFSCRMMWRTDGSGGSGLNPDMANMVQYVYHPDQPGTFGEDFRWDDGLLGDWKQFESDRWYQLRHRIVMNTPGQNDGIMIAWLDGELVLFEDNIRFRDIASLEIDQMYFSTFFGGGSSIWATSKDEYAYFDDFKITVVPSTPVTVAPESFLVTRGTRRTGGLGELTESDNQDLSIQKSTTDVQSVCELEAKTTSPSASPILIEVTVEASVFARTPVTQNIALYNFVADSFEVVDSRAAARFSDATVSVQASGDLSRFLDANGCIRARVAFVSAIPRQQFSANVDLISWSVQ